MKLRCMIVDDDEFSRQAVEFMVKKMPLLDLVAVCSGADQAMKELRSGQVDLIFLDIEMPGMTGLEMMEVLGERAPQVIFITSKKEYAADGFDLNVTDFLSKPIQYARFQKAVSKARERFENDWEVRQKEDAIFVKSGSRFVRLYFNDIVLIEGLGDYVNIHTQQGKHTIHATMKSLEERLSKKDFMRVHLSYIVRVDKIAEMKDNLLVLGKHTIPVSRTHRKALIEKLNLL
ncbi:MAG TPA: LytTR family DNA-binding domain-containing protein [Bacteroidia bacterium]|jgi:DNA-binding LytR/AlgR family response regulator